ncbi:MAG: hypothetical protein HY540_03035 [Deltaproteobacteria bacterium]|nr:hypothetical protein [Deltaproteobacteria bacterium]
MTLELGHFDFMSYLWENLDKTEDGEHVCYTPEDIDALWEMGFVDTKQFSLATWHEAFAAYRTSNKSVIISKVAFFNLDRYRYKGEIRIPFDAMKINEGQYTEEGLGELFDVSVKPSVKLSTSELSMFLKKLKADFRNPNHLIKIGPEAKLRIKKLLDQHPSPLRNFELIFDHLFTKYEREGIPEKATNANLGRKASPQHQRSSFTTTPLTKSELHAKELKTLTKANLASSHACENTSVTLKQLRRSGKGLRG